jgi:hypothetical protein
MAINTILLDFKVEESTKLGMPGLLLIFEMDERKFNSNNAFFADS